MPEYETAGAAESPQKQTLGPLTFPVAAIEGDRLGKGPLGRREWFFLENIRRGDSNLFGLMQRDDIAGVRGGAVHSLGS